MSYTGENEEMEESVLRNTKVLSANELFHWRKKENTSVPQRGGSKNYEPDDSWLQDKQLEAFYEEHLSVLQEPRVEKSGNLVRGTWDPDKRSVSIEKTAKFWMKMGFVDQNQNWLHPEEALFLMEVNCLELIHQGLSLSLQEAYSLLLHPSCGISEEEYQVYAHLRRLGYIVIRHAGKLNLTAYERKIGLDKHTKKKSSKGAKKKNLKMTSPEIINQVNVHSDKCADDQQTDKSSENTVPEAETHSGGGAYSDSQRSNRLPSAANHAANREDNSRSNIADTEVQHRDMHKDLSCEDKSNVKMDSCVESSLQQNQVKLIKGNKDIQDIGENFLPLHLKPVNNTAVLAMEKEVKDSWNEEPEILSDMKKGETDLANSVICDTISAEPPNKKMRLDYYDNKSTSSTLTEPSGRYMMHEADLWSDVTQKSLNKQNTGSLTCCDFSMIHLPDIAGKETVLLSIPPSHLLPPHISIDEEYEDVCMFDVEEYRRQQLQQHSWRDEREDYGHLKHLKFSYAEWLQSNFRPAAKNWREWKAELCEREKNFPTETPVAHLWQGEVTPLVKPTDAVSTAALLDKLSVIKSFEGPFPDLQNDEIVKISFDVYLPNTNFKKSNPGVPDHRVCVAKGEQPPNVFQVHMATAHLNDKIPLHWAVVNSGEVSFLVFDEFEIPALPPSLG